MRAGRGHTLRRLVRRTCNGCRFEWLTFEHNLDEDDCLHCGSSVVHTRPFDVKADHGHHKPPKLKLISNEERPT